MFVNCSLETSLDLGLLRVHEAGSLQSWFQSVAEELKAQQGQWLHADVAPKPLTGQGPLRFEVDDAQLDEGAISIPFRVWAGSFEEAWSSFRGVVSASWFGDRLTRLELIGHYRPPEGLQPDEELLLHRAVDALGSRFLVGVVTELRERLGNLAIADNMTLPGGS